MKVNFLKFETREELWSRTLDLIQGENIGVSGGSAGEIMRILESNYKKWSDKSFFLVDERIVEESSQYSNYGSLKKYVSNLKLHKLEENSDRLPNNLDTIVMGVGQDGHIASLFRYDDIVKEAKVVRTFSSDNQTRERLSLSFEYLLKAKRVVFVLFGEEKEAIWLETQKNKKTELVITQFLRNFKGDCFVFWTK